MIHQALGHAYVLSDSGDPVPVCGATPRDGARFADEDAVPEGDAIACMIEAARDWLAWIFEAGPHPYAVMRRLLACTSANAPWLLQGMDSREVLAVAGVKATEKTALRRVCHCTPQQVLERLAAAYRRSGRTWQAVATISTLEMRLMVEETASPEDAVLRARAMELWLRRVWDGGPSLGEAMKALYVEARTLAPDLILNMSGAEIAGLFAQGRAAESARVKQRVNVRLLRAGCRRTTLRFQKSTTACDKYAQGARGNKNRAGSVAAKPAA